jgi:hypothetical protein
MVRSILLHLLDEVLSKESEEIPIINWLIRASVIEDANIYSEEDRSGSPLYIELYFSYHILLY